MTDVICPKCMQTYSLRGIRMHMDKCVGNAQASTSRLDAQQPMPVEVQPNAQPEADNEQLSDEDRLHRLVDSLVEEKMQQMLNDNEHAVHDTDVESVGFQNDINSFIPFQELDNCLKGEQEVEENMLDEDDKKEIANIVSNQMAPFQRELNERDKNMSRYQEERDRQMGNHLSDFKRSLDAMNARHAQYSHRIDAMKEELMTKFKPAPIPESEPKPEPPRGLPKEKPEPVEEPTEEILFIGECPKGHYFFEQGEEHIKACPECGARVIRYPSPKRVKTKKKSK